MGILEQLKLLAEQKADARVKGGVGPSTTLAAALAGLGAVGEVVSDNDTNPDMSDRDFQRLCQGVTVTVVELAVLLQYWNVDLGFVLQTFFDVVNTPKEDQKPPAPILRLVRTKDEGDPN